MTEGKRNLRMSVMASLAVAAMVQPLVAELPTMKEKEWLGYFVGFENKRYRFGVTTAGDSIIRIIGKKDEPLGQKLNVDIDFVVEEILPDGKITRKSVIPATLESDQGATTDPADVVIRGQVTGNAKFEVVVSGDKGLISLGGRLLDPGSLKNPLRFSIQVKIPNAYPYEKGDADRKQQKAFEDKARGDRLQLTWTNGKRVKQSTSEAVDAASDDLNGPGIAAAQIEFSSYQDNRIEVSASGNSVMKLSNARKEPLNAGFLVTWSADPAKDPEGKARLNLEVK